MFSAHFPDDFKDHCNVSLNQANCVNGFGILKF